ncbi:hypothetical protein H1C71_040507 [Ictidomys tridecemlineatus]|nr:hypothetical protein H1C71_040507 [Ictidomys tridecemlineatus]
MRGISSKHPPVKLNETLGNRQPPAGESVSKVSGIQALEGRSASPPSCGHKTRWQHPVEAGGGRGFSRQAPSPSPPPSAEAACSQLPREQHRGPSLPSVPEL